MSTTQKESWNGETLYLISDNSVVFERDNFSVLDYLGETLPGEGINLSTYYHTPNSTVTETKDTYDC